MHRRSDAWIGLALLVFCGVMYVSGLGLPKAPYGTMGPAFMPNLILGVTAVLSLLLTVSGFLATDGPDERPVLSAAESLFKYRNIWFSFGLFFVFALLLPFLGYVVTSFLFLFVLQLLLGPKERRMIPSYLGVSLGMMLLIFLIFRCMLLVILPESEFDTLRLLEDGTYVCICDSWEVVSGLWH